MKVALVGSYYAPYVGGIESHMRDLAEALTRRGDEVTVVSLTLKPGTPATTESIGGVPVSRVSWLGIGSTLVLPARLALDCDVVHFHGFSRPLFFRTIIENAGRRPFVLTTHGGITGAVTDANPFRRYLKKRFDAIIGGVMRDRVSHIIAISEAEKEDFIQRFGIDANRVSVFPNALPSSAFEIPAVPAGASNRIAVIGRLAKVKRITDVIKAVTSDEKVPPCDIYGPPADAFEEIKSALKRADPNRVRLHPPIFGAEKNRVIRSAAAVVIASETEANPIVALEALAQETVVVASRGASSSLPAGTYIPFATGNIESLIAALKSIGSFRRDSEAKRSSARAALRSTDDFAATVGQLYRDLCRLS